MIIPGFGDVAPNKLPRNHPVALAGKPSGYPARFLVPVNKVSWDVQLDGYQPPEYTAPDVLAAPVWAHPTLISQITRAEIHSYYSLLFNEAGYPLNPVGRTGLSGRGLLGKWGANFAADPIILWHSPEGRIFLLAIERADCGMISLPGGMCELGDTIGSTLRRELQEETNVAELDMSQGEIVYCGYVDDPRNTDHAWMETIAALLVIDYQLAMSLPIEAGDDASKVFRLELTKPLLNGGMYASHGTLVRRALEQFAKKDAKAALAIAELLAA